MNDRTRRDRVRAEYAAANAVTQYRTPTGRSTKDYYANGKHGTMGGVPIWRPAWYGQLGNDKEFLEATKPRTEFKAAYYAGGHRMTVDGIPVRVAAYVKDLAPWMKRAIGGGSQTDKEAKAIEVQLEILFPAFGREQALTRKSGMACCLDCRKEYYAGNEHGAVKCWNCKSEERIAA